MQPLVRSHDRPSSLDVVLAVALAAAAQAEIWLPVIVPGTGEVTGSKPLLAVTAACITLPLALRRNAPVPVAAVVLLAATAQARLTEPTGGLTTLIAIALAMVAVGSDVQDGWSGPVLIVLGAAGLAQGTGDAAFVAVVLGGAYVAGRAIRRRVERLVDLEQRRAEDVAAATESERLRIARELHDIVAHRVSTIVVQAQAADAVLDADPAAARRSLHAIDDSARRALSELRSLLGILRDPAADPGREPQPELRDVVPMVDRARRAGQPIDFVIDGNPRPVAPAIAVTAYRIAQEALTNALKHAPGASTSVTIRYAPDVIEIDVRDDGPGALDGERGFGLVGMRERVGFVGGTLAVGNRPEGGFEVLARLPTAGPGAS